jgi:hypothetical protein
LLVALVLILGLVVVGRLLPLLGHHPQSDAICFKLSKSSLSYIVGYERYKLSMLLRVGPSVLGERLAQARAIKASQPKTIEHQA